MIYYMLYSQSKPKKLFQLWSILMLRKKDTLAPIPDELMERCKRAAKRRTQENLAKSWWKDSKKSTEPQETIELRGIVCEASMALTLGVDIEQVFRPGNRSAVKGTDLGDLNFDGVLMDIKGVRYSYSNLLVSPTKKNTPIDIFVLVHEDEKWGNRFLGAIPFHKAFGQKIILQDGTDLGNGLRQDQLLNLDDAIREAKEERVKIIRALSRD